MQRYVSKTLYWILNMVIDLPTSATTIPNCTMHSLLGGLSSLALCRSLVVTQKITGLEPPDSSMGMIIMTDGRVTVPCVCPSCLSFISSQQTSSFIWHQTGISDRQTLLLCLEKKDQNLLLSLSLLGFHLKWMMWSMCFVLKSGATLWQASQQSSNEMHDKNNFPSCIVFDVFKCRIILK